MPPTPRIGRRIAAHVFGAAVVLLAGVIGTVDAATPALEDSTLAVSYWGPLPARSDSTEARFAAPGHTWWETTLLVPYHVVGVPVTMIDRGLKGTLVTLDHLGAFNFAADVVGGFRDPLGNFWLPEFAIGDSEGLRYGLVGRRVTNLLGRTDFRLGLSSSTRQAYKLTLGALWRPEPDRWFEIGGGAQEKTQEAYYGLGVGTTPDGESRYNRTTDWVGLSFWRDLGRPEVLFGAHYSTAEARSAQHETHESLEVIHADDLPPGWDERSSGLGVVLRLAWDTTEETGRPDRGSRLVGGAQTFLASDGSDLRFTTVRISAETFQQVGLPQRTLALKAFALRQYDTDGGPIPFQRRLNNRSPDKLRGFRSSRFYALGLLGATAEYRWPLWTLNRPSQTGADFYVFADVGQPFDRTAEIAWKNLLVTPGFGVRVIDGLSRFSLRCELAFSSEGVQLHLTGSQVFQYLKTGFYDGRHPVPILR